MPKPPQRKGRVHVARAPLLLGACGAGLFLLAWWLAGARGSFFITYTSDPAYAYLFNALRLAEGVSPVHIDHPGTTVQLLGAGVLRAVHAFRAGPLRDDVLCNPELFLRSMQAALLAVTIALAVGGGALAFRATGRVAHAALVTLAPLACLAGALMLDCVQPEPLLLGIGAALSGLTLLALHRTASPREGRVAIALGVLVALGIATKVLFAPGAIVPLAALSARRTRLRYLAGLFGTLVLAGLVILPRLPKLASWVASVAFHTGDYGRGESGVFNLSIALRNIVDVIVQEPLYTAIALGGLVVAALHLAIGGRADNEARRLRRTLAAASLAQGALLLVIAKQPVPRYLIPGAGLCGLVLSLSISLLSQVSPGPVRRRGAVLGVALLALAGAWQGRAVWIQGRLLNDTIAGERATADFLAGPESAGVLLGSRVSSIPAALQFGNWYAGGRYGPDLARLYPGAIHWDRDGIHRFGRSPPLPAPDLLRAGFRAVIPNPIFPFQTPASPSLDEVAITTERSFQRARLVRVLPLRGDPAFCGFRAFAGLGLVEGPLRVSGQDAEIIRWGLAPSTRLQFRSSTPATLTLEGRPIPRRTQRLDIILDGKLLQRHEFAWPPRFETVEASLPAAPAGAVVELRYSLADDSDLRRPAVLFRALRVLPRAHDEPPPP